MGIEDIIAIIIVRISISGLVNIHRGHYVGGIRRKVRVSLFVGWGFYG